MKGQSSTEKRKKIRRSLERRGNNLRVNLFSTPKKRRRNEQTQKESFIMKLFDRSLDLSKYTETTPLYPICRAWMLNQPRNPNILSYRQLTRNLNDLDDRKVKRENNGAEMLRRITKNELRGEHMVVTALPAPLNIEVPKMPKINEGIKPDLQALDAALKPKEDESDPAENLTKLEETNASLLADHKTKWTNIKCNWLKHARNADKRYELNQLIIKKLFKP